MNATPAWRLGLLMFAAGFALLGPAAAQEQATRWQTLAPFTRPPAEFASDLGPYRSPLRFADNTEVKTPEDWARRRTEILATWHRRLGAWPPLVERPTVKRLESVERDDHVQHHVHVQIDPQGKVADGYLLIPKGRGPFPAVFVPFYEPLTSIGQGAKGRGKGTHDYGLQLVRRGFVTLSIGTPGSVENIGADTRQLLTEAGVRARRQPLTLLAYAAANCHTALAQLAEVDPQRIGIIGLSYGGKWSMFASCLHDKFACAVWSDPGIVFNEKNSNVNYWEPWYLGYDPKTKRKPGVPSTENPRTGLYKELVDAGEDLVDLHALMAPRPVLVSGGTEDPPRNWRALNHLAAVNKLLGHTDRVALTSRKTHVPTAEALELELAYLEYWLKYALAPATRDRKGQPPGPLAGWSAGVRIHPVLGDAERHSIHAYFNTVPESPDGTRVLLYTSTTPEAHEGELWLVERTTGQTTVLARNVVVEDAHRAACQQWLAGGRRVAFHDRRDGRWVVVVMDTDTLKARVLAEGRQLGWGQPHADLLPLYGPHWAPGAHRDLELLDVRTGEIRTSVTAAAVRAAYLEWVAKRFGDRPISIFFPILSPDLTRVVFKVATPADGDFRSKQASERDGLLCYDLKAGRFLWLHERWGHPAWHPDARSLINYDSKGLYVIDAETGAIRRPAMLPTFPGSHPSFGPSGSYFATDFMPTNAGVAGLWAVAVGSLEHGEHVVPHPFDNTRGSTSWRRSHPQPIFSADGQRLYFNVSADRWTRLFVAECSGRE